MQKRNVSFDSLISCEQEGIHIIRKKKSILKCPLCEKDEFVMDTVLGIGYCKHCGAFSDMTEDRNKWKHAFDYDSESNPITPIFNESIANAKKHEEEFKKAMKMYGLDVGMASRTGIGYIPYGSWVRRREDTSEMGKISIPLATVGGKVCNIIAMNISDGIFSSCNEFGSEGFINRRALWNEEVYVFTNPFDCVVAIQSGKKNSIFMDRKASFPKIDIPIWKKVYIFGYRSQNDTIYIMRESLKNAGVDVGVCFPDNTGAASWAEYLRKSQ